MTSQAQQSGPTLATVSGGSGVPAPPSNPDRLQQCFDHGIWYALSLWPALRVACENSWGGEATQDKRDWFAGAVSELLIDRPDTDADDLEVFLLQVMQDEFECNVEDDSEVAAARDILRLRKSLVEDKRLSVYLELQQRWQNRGQLKTDQIKIIDGTVEGDNDDEEWEGLDDTDEDLDVDMDVPRLARAKEKVEPEVDEEGFTKVISRKKR